MCLHINNADSWVLIKLKGSSQLKKKKTNKIRELEWWPWRSSMWIASVNQSGGNAFAFGNQTVVELDSEYLIVLGLNSWFFSLQEETLRNMQVKFYSCLYQFNPKRSPGPSRSSSMGLPGMGVLSITDLYSPDPSDSSASSVPWDPRHCA